MTRTLVLTLFSMVSFAIAGEKATHEKQSSVMQPSWFSWDFQERIRFEIRENNFDFNNGVSTINDDHWFLQRARLGFKIQPSDSFFFYVQGQSSFEIDSNRPNQPGVLGAEGDDPLDLRQAYIKWGSAQFNVTMGRQILGFGDERLIGGFDWNNIGRTFDAIKFHFGRDQWSLDAFASSVVMSNRHEFNTSDIFDGNESHRDQVFSGVYFSTRAWGLQVTDLYALHLFENYGSNDTSFLTLGTRIKADTEKTGGFDYELELAYQFGSVVGKELEAFAAHAGLGYVWLNHRIKPRIFVEYNYGTGDSNASDDKVETFENLFPTNHKFYGYMDIFSWQNMHNPAVSISVQPHGKLKLQADYHAFWLADTSDAWYRANGVTAVRPINASVSRFVGTELDFSAQWKANKHLSFLVGYSHFFTGRYVKSSGENDDADFGYIQTTFEF